MPKQDGVPIGVLGAAGAILRTAAAAPVTGMMEPFEAYELSSERAARSRPDLAVVEECPNGERWRPGPLVALRGSSRDHIPAESDERESGR
jgi:hypothetical protein